MRRSNLLFDLHSCPTPAFAELLRVANVPGTNLAEINHALQARFFQKGPDQQPLVRWKFEDVGVECSILPHLAKCGFLEKTEPSLRQYLYAGLPGALVVAAARRICDLIDVWNSGVRWKRTIVFGSTRPLVPERETPAALHKAFPKQFRVSDTAFHQGFGFFVSAGYDTEAKMLEWLWYCANMPHELMVTATFMEAPSKPPLTGGGPPRHANTEDTVEAWVQTRPEPGLLLLSSGAPYGMAQDETVARVLAPYGIGVETFGHEAPMNLGIPVLMREVAGAVHSILKTRNV